MNTSIIEVRFFIGLIMYKRSENCFAFRTATSHRYEPPESYSHHHHKGGKSFTLRSIDTESKPNASIEKIVVNDSAPLKIIVTREIGNTSITENVKNVSTVALEVQKNDTDIKVEVNATEEVKNVTKRGCCDEKRTDLNKQTKRQAETSETLQNKISRDIDNVMTNFNLDKVIRNIRSNNITNQSLDDVSSLNITKRFTSNIPPSDVVASNNSDIKLTIRDDTMQIDLSSNRPNGGPLKGVISEEQRMRHNKTLVKRNTECKCGVFPKETVAFNETAIISKSISNLCGKENDTWECERQCKELLLKESTPEKLCAVVVDGSNLIVSP